MWLDQIMWHLICTGLQVSPSTPGVCGCRDNAMVQMLAIGALPGTVHEHG